MLKSVLNKFAMNEKVTSDMIMGDIIRLHPEVVDTLISQGMHCLGCPSSRGETVEEACLVHGIDTDAFLIQVNKFLEASEEAGL